MTKAAAAKVTRRRRVSACLVATGTVTLLGTLAIAVYSEVTRPPRKDEIAKLVLITAADGREASSDAIHITIVYEEFLRLQLDVETASTAEGKTKLDKLTPLLKLKLAEVSNQRNAALLSNESEMFDKLYGWLKEEASVTKQLRLLSAERNMILHILRQLKLDSRASDIFAIEVWPTEVRLVMFSPGPANRFEVLTNFAALNLLWEALCPASTADDTRCKLETS